ncbi:MAG: DUF2142 domain-containing protein [Methanobrevibacter sp.]|nr:DUF2142 domain-containing protein [Methanobrevibacter sp.]
MSILISIILGFFCLLYYFNNKNDLHKVAFITIICFGIISALIAPILAIPDENEHFARAILTSQGNLFPQYIHPSSNLTGIDTFGWAVGSTQSFFDLASQVSLTFFKSNALNMPIDNSQAYFARAFLHNPFYGYLAQGFGILIANLLNLGLIWTLWLGRIFNLILYAVFVAIAIKKTPILKVPMLFMALLPLAVYQGASLSIDATVNGLGFIVVAYFFYLFKSDDASITLKEISIFSILVLLLSLEKVTYIVFILLLLCVPKSKFKVPYYYNIIFIVAVGALTLLWSQYNTPIYDLSRKDYYVLNNVSSPMQINYIMNHPTDGVFAILNIIPTIWDMFYYTFSMYSGTVIYSSSSLTFIGLASIVLVTFLYPIKEKIPLKYRISLLIIIAINYFGTYIIQLLKWTPVSQIYNILGVQSRYFIPLFGLLPFIFAFDYKNLDEEIAKNIIVLISISLLISLTTSTLFQFY